MEKITVTEEYRELGKFLREKGAEKVILLSAKRKEKSREFEIVIEGSCDMEMLRKALSSRWPEDRIILRNREELENWKEMQEIEEDGIVL